jgi:hypothetical protein
LTRDAWAAWSEKSGHAARGSAVHRRGVSGCRRLGAVTEANVVVTNLTRDGLPTPIAIIGVPGGLEPRHDQLKELVKSGEIAAYEVVGRDVVLYWRELKPEQRVSFPLSLVAVVPGSYTGPASRAYLYYTDEFKTWVDATKVVVTPRVGG